VVRADARVGYAREWGLLFERQGLPRIAGAMWGWLLVCSPPEQTQEQLVQALDVAKGSVSTNARLLERVGFIERVAGAGSRSARYRIRPDAFEALMLEKLESTVRWRRLADRGVELATRSPSIRVDRLKVLRRFYAFMEKEQAAVIARWRRR